MRFLTMWLILLSPVLTNADNPISIPEAAALLQMAVDAQLAREANWKQGVMRVSISQTGANAMSAELTLAWHGQKSFVDVRRFKTQSLSVEGKLHEEDSNPFRKCMSPAEEWAYFPTLAAVYGWGGDKLRGIPSSIDVTPMKAWGTVPFIRQIRLADSMGRSIANGKLSGTRLDNGLVRIASGARVYVIDPVNDGDIVRIENDLAERPPEEARLASPHMFVATYDWERDQQGVPYCHKYRAELFQEDDPDDPVIVREVIVTEYTSELSDERKRFDLASLEVPKGTKVKYLDSKSQRTWRHGVRGSEAEGLQQPDFDRLIEQMKQDGFAAPDEEG